MTRRGVRCVFYKGCWNELYVRHKTPRQDTKTQDTKQQTSTKNRRQYETPQRLQKNHTQDTNSQAKPNHTHTHTHRRTNLQKNLEIVIYM